MRLFGRRRDDELVDEIDTHLSLLEDEYRRAGMSDAEARDAAQRNFGGVLKTRQAYREQRRWRWIDAIAQDIRFGVRVLLRDRGFALTAVLVLALGIGVNNMMFTLIYGSTLRGLPIEHADRVLYMSTFDQRFPDRPLSYPDFEDLRTQARSFAGLAAFLSAPLAVGDEGRVPERFEGAYTSAGAFELIGAPIFGRTFTQDEDRTGQIPTAVLSRRVWQSRYAADPDILGRSIYVNGAPAMVIGVLPDRSGFPSTAEVWLPLVHAPTLASERRDMRALRVFGRIRDDVSEHDARAEVQSIIAGIARDHPDTSAGLTARVVRIDERFFGGLSNPNWRPFIAASILVVLVSCANAANLMIGRSVLRAREIAIRGSLGASRARVICQFLVEALVLACVSGAVALAISVGAAQIFQSAIPENTLPYWLHYSMDWRVFSALVAVSLATVLVFGLVPAIQASRTDVNRTLRDGGRSGTAKGGSSRRLTSAFLVVQLGLSVVLLAQVVISFQVTASRVDSNSAVDTPALLAANLTLPAAQYRSAAERLSFYERVREHLQTLSGVSGVAVASHVPLAGGFEQRFEIDGRPRADGEQSPSVFTVTVGPQYFATLTLPLLRGREFSSQDGQPGYAHAIVNQRLVERYFPDGDVLGRQIRVTAPNTPPNEAAWLTIIGVAPNVRQRNLLDSDPIVYLPLASTPLPSASLLVRSGMDPATATRRVKEEVARLDPHLPLYRVMTMQQAIYEGSWNGRVSHNLILTITAVALALSMIGLYAVTAYAVGQRTQEIGIRVALGARPEQIRRLILLRAFVQVALGLVVGLIGSMAWAALFSDLTSDGGPRVRLELVSPTVIGPVVLFLAGLTVVACLVPLRRATGLDPVTALRQD